MGMLLPFVFFVAASVDPNQSILARAGARLFRVSGAEEIAAVMARFVDPLHKWDAFKKRDRKRQRRDCGP